MHCRTYNWAAFQRSIAALYERRRVAQQYGCFAEVGLYYEPGEKWKQHDELHHGQHLHPEGLPSPRRPFEEYDRDPWSLDILEQFLPGGPPLLQLLGNEVFSNALKRFLEGPVCETVLPGEVL